MINTEKYLSSLIRLGFSNFRILRNTQEASFNINDIYKTVCLDVYTEYRGKSMILNGAYKTIESAQNKVDLVSERIKYFATNPLSFASFKSRKIINIEGLFFILYKYIPGEYISVDDIGSQSFMSLLVDINRVNGLQHSGELMIDISYSHGPIYLDIDIENFLIHKNEIIFLDYESIVVGNTIFQVLHYYLYLRQKGVRLYKRCTIKLLLLLLKENRLVRNDLYQNLLFLNNSFFSKEDVDDFSEILTSVKDKI